VRFTKRSDLKKVFTLMLERDEKRFDSS
jgi:hypothetical protein